MFSFRCLRGLKRVLNRHTFKKETTTTIRKNQQKTNGLVSITTQKNNHLLKTSLSCINNVYSSSSIQQRMNDWNVKDKLRELTEKKSTPFKFRNDNGRSSLSLQLLIALWVMIENGI
eukprot:TRINITY_DN1969_c0_g1_i1.p1 TRINITY_DN1969_c0_g1~~TRINITY_DN1969_c0_g1_i1.p1  ORF type:complete len:117 (+),score=11.72 TRINITY_DN1969_c0_g1_i1:68-418(+)